MPRRITQTILAGALCAVALSAGILPEQLGKVRRGPVTSELPKDPVLSEYGLVASEQAAYGSLKILAWRFQDTTGAMSGLQYVRPADAKPSKFEKHAAQAAGVIYATHGNYLFQFSGGEPDETQYNQLIYHVPNIEQSSLPVISTYLPPDGLVPNSERYITGPVALEKFLPGVPPSVAAFHLSAEAQFGRYRTKDGAEMNLAIFSYPTPVMARERADALGKLAGVVVKRSGPLVVLTVNPPNADEAERLLGKVFYSAQLTWNEKPKENIAQSTAQMLLGIFKLAGIVIVFCLLSGLLVAGLRQFNRKIGKEDAEGAMITLHLQGK